MHIRFLSEDLKGQRSLGRYRCSWKHNIKIHFVEIICNEFFLI
jgi:hypothetical protein